MTLTSHQYADKLREIADFLLSRPAFLTEEDEGRIALHFFDKGLAIAAVESVQPDSSDEAKVSNLYLNLEKCIAPDVKLCLGIYRAVALEVEPPEPQPAIVRIAPEFIIPKPASANIA